jgi:hypothetical protein
MIGQFRSKTHTDPTNDVYKITYGLVDVSSDRFLYTIKVEQGHAIDTIVLNKVPKRVLLISIAFSH